jgi:hypothetical protein
MGGRTFAITNINAAKCVEQIVTEAQNCAVIVVSSRDISIFAL